MSRPRVDRAALLTGARSKVAAPAVNPLLPVEPPGAPDPFAPQPIDPAAVTGTDAERLAALEAAMDRAKETAAETLKASRARFVIEAGLALREIRGQELYRLGHGTFEDYIEVRWGMDRTRAYQLIDAAPAMLAMSKIFHTPPVESQARALSPILRDHGESAARDVVTAAQQEAGKITAASIKATASRLGYIPSPAPAPAAEDDGQALADDSPQEDRRLVLLEQGMATLRTAHRQLRGSVLADAIGADPDRGREIAAEAAKVAARIARIAEKNARV